MTSHGSRRRRLSAPSRSNCSRPRSASPAPRFGQAGTPRTPTILLTCFSGVRKAPTFSLGRSTGRITSGSRTSCARTWSGTGCATRTNTPMCGRVPIAANPKRGCFATGASARSTRRKTWCGSTALTGALPRTRRRRSGAVSSRILSTSTPRFTSLAFRPKRFRHCSIACRTRGNGRCAATAPGPRQSTT